MTCFVLLFLFQMQNPNTSSHVPQQTDGNKNPSTSVSMLNPEPSAQTTNNQRNQISEDQRIKVTEVPTIHINTDWRDDVNVGVSVLLVIVGFLQVVVLLRQAAIADRQELQMEDAGRKTDAIIAQMKDAAQKELRAYLHVSKIFLNLDDPALPIGCVEVQNFGQTPAYSVRQWAVIAPNQFPLHPATQWPTPTDDGSVAVMPPHAFPHSHYVSLKKPLAPDHIFTGSKPWVIYVYGEIAYQDIFKETRNTKFRYFFGGGSEASVIQTTEDGHKRGIMKPYPEGNEAD